MKNLGKILMLVALISCYGVVSYAQTPADLTKEETQMVEMMRKKKDEMKAKMIKDLGLTEEQQQKLEDHRNKHRSQMEANKEVSENLHEQLKAELEKTEVDVAKIYSIHQQIKTLNNEEADHRLEGILEVRKILTAEQFKKFQEKTQGRKGPGGPGGKGPHGKHQGGKRGPGEPIFEER